MKRVILVGLLFLGAGCTSEEKTRETLTAAGFRDIQVQGYALWGCSDSDDFATKFSATNPTGLIVNGVVCCGWLKSCTIRF